MKVAQLFLGVSFLAHWLACIWSLISILYTPISDALDSEGRPMPLTWVAKYIRDQQDLGVQVGGHDVYIAALYWSIMTLTSIGYGDFVPVNSVERALCSVYMVVSAGGWAYVIGTAAGIAATLDPNSVIYHTTM